MERIIRLIARQKDTQGVKDTARDTTAEGDRRRQRETEREGEKIHRGCVSIERMQPKYVANIYNMAICPN